MSKQQYMYKPIDQTKSGRKLKIMLETSGYDVKYIQDFLHLSCPQSIYRWYKGNALPSLEHISAISRLLQVHMEDLLVLQGESLVHSLATSIKDSHTKRLLSYIMCFEKIA